MKGVCYYLWSSTPAQPEVGVGTADTANCVVNLSGGDNPHENTITGIANEVYTFDAGSGGVISGVGAPTGFVTNIATGGQTATATGIGSGSFDLSATVSYATGGNETVTCKGVVTYNDGSSVDSSPSGADSLIAVQVDSVKLIPDQSTQTTSEPFGSETVVSNYDIGQTLTRADFTITTTPVGHGNDRLSGSAKPPYVVTLSPTSFALAVGDNKVTASTGPSPAPTSSAGVDVVGMDTTGQVGSIKVTGPGTAIYNFTAEVQGAAGTCQASGPDVSGSASGQLTEGQPTPVPVQLSFSAQQDTTDQLQITATQPSGSSSGSGGSPSSDAARPAGIIGEGGLSDLIDGAGEIQLVLFVEFHSSAVTLTPQNPQLNLELTTSAPQNYKLPFTTNTALANWSASGWARVAFVPPTYLYTHSPVFDISVGAPNHPNDFNLITKTNFDFVTSCDMSAPIVDIADGGNINDTKLFFQGPGDQQKDDNEAGHSHAGGSLSGDCMIMEDTDCTASLSTNPADAGWVAKGASEAVVSAKWDPF